LARFVRVPDLVRDLNECEILLPRESRFRVIGRTDPEQIKLEVIHSMSPTRKPRAEPFVSREGDFVVVKPGEEPKRPGRPRERVGPGLELGELRRARNITQEELAATMGVDQAQVSRLEGRGDFRLSTLLEYLRGLGATGAAIAVNFDDAPDVVLPVDLLPSEVKR
jgi:hypothetical protein